MRVNPIYIQRLLSENTPDNIKMIIGFFQNPSISNLDEIKGVLVKAINKGGNFLHWLAANNQSDIMRDLVAQGALFNIKDSANNTPLHIAVKYGSYDAMIFIMSKDIIAQHDYLPESETKNSNGLTPYDIALNMQDRESIRLIEHYTRQFWQSRESKPVSVSVRRTGGTRLPPLHSSLSSLSIQPDTSWRDVACEQPWLAKPTGQLQWKDLSANQDLMQNVSLQRWGTGVLISGEMLLSAGHCFDEQDSSTGWYLRHAGTDEAITPKEIPYYMTINFNYQNPFCDAGKLYSVTPEAYEAKFELTSLLEHRIGDLDYAIIKVKQSNYNMTTDQFGFAPLSARMPQNGESVIVVQHPLGEPKKIAEGNVTAIRGSKMYYYLDTEGGSSGSPVGGSDHTVVAVHTNGINDNPRERALGNSGVTIAAISKHSPRLFSLAQQDVTASSESVSASSNPSYTRRRY